MCSEEDDEIDQIIGGAYAGKGQYPYMVSYLNHILLPLIYGSFFDAWYVYFEGLLYGPNKQTVLLRNADHSE